MTSSLRLITFILIGNVFARAKLVSKRQTFWPYFGGWPGGTPMASPFFGSPSSPYGFPSPFAMPYQFPIAPYPPMRGYNDVNYGLSSPSSTAFPTLATIPEKTYPNANYQPTTTYAPLPSPVIPTPTAPSYSPYNSPTFQQPFAPSFAGGNNIDLDNEPTHDPPSPSLLRRRNRNRQNINSMGWWQGFTNNQA